MSTKRYTSIGQMSITQANDMNIPVNCFLSEPGSDEGQDKWEWTADNFMPRKGHIASDQYHLQANTREALVAAVARHVVPLYRAALTNLETTGENYFWSKP